MRAVDDLWRGLVGKPGELGAGTRIEGVSRRAKYRRAGDHGLGIPAEELHQLDIAPGIERAGEAASVGSHVGLRRHPAVKQDPDVTHAARTRPRRARAWLSPRRRRRA